MVQYSLRFHQRGISVQTHNQIGPKGKETNIKITKYVNLFLNEEIKKSK